MPSIPASAIVNVIPNTVSAGGGGVSAIGLLLTTSAQIPAGTVLAFSSANDVATYFGASATEAALAATYFSGYDNSNQKPGSLLFYRYATAAQSAFLRGGSLSGLTLAQLNALAAGTISITVGGTVKTSSSISLSAATSFSNAATIIQGAFTSPGFTVAYDSVSGAFVFTSTATGATASLSFASNGMGTLADALLLTQAKGAVLSAGMDVSTPAGAMAAVTAQTQNFVAFTTAWQPSDTDKLAFSAWANGQNNRYLYAGWDSNAAAAAANDTTSFGAQVKAAGYSGTAAIYDPANGANLAAFLLGAIASLNFGTRNGRATMAFRTGSIVAGVTDQSAAANLAANGYNFVGAYASADSRWTFLYPGQISGKFLWIDSFICQIWMNSRFQASLMQLLTSVGQVPYNSEGNALIEGALRTPIDDALYFGAIRTGVPLSASQKAQINNAAGGNIADTIQQRGWYVLVGPASAAVRAARASPPITVWYTDGQSVQQITLSSFNVQ